MNDIIISLQNISAEYDGEKVIDKLNLDIRDHEFVTFLGPSGCGKTTTLRIIGGFIEPTEGDVFFEGEKINGLPPFKRNVNTVFQRYALFPHLDVYGNIAFGLKQKKVPKDEIRARVSRMLKLVNLEGYETRKVDQLSGGQQQRVAIARALINEPKVLLLDEPLGALDLKLRKEMQLELKRIQQTLGITFVYVTHDQEEALTMSDRVLVMRRGEILQTGSPEDIYNEPINAFVADFIGESNIVDGIMLEDYLVEFAGVQFECVDAGFDPMEDVDVVIRPEDFKMVEPEEGQIKGKVESITFKGVHFEIIMDGHGYKWMIHSTQSREVGAMIGLTLTPDDIHIMHKMKEDEV
ncbi:MAG: ABC transporter ATP-binding protein [Firmicutes bacterium]|jgi:spermidine/putrescine transport system ATP-binding protein|nr:ABC transporter ATP-binding protein [Bacillota bacterium]